jgi:quinol-cytochrome oxidoreductase complex cytochrome b subunit
MYGLHIALMPILVISMVGLHIVLVRMHGVVRPIEPKKKSQPADKEQAS